MQRISITVTLNRSTLQFEESAYQRPEQYLAEAGRTLDGNPDQAEILADLEQAVADQCASRLRPDQGVVTLAELQPALVEIGSVQVPGAAGETARSRQRHPAAPAGERGGTDQRRVPGIRPLLPDRRDAAARHCRAAAARERRRHDPGVRGADALLPDKVIAWPQGVRVAEAAALEDKLLVVVTHGKTVELLTIKAGKIERDPIPLDDLRPIVGLAGDRAGRVVVALRDGRLAVRDGAAWTVTEVRDELPAVKPGPAPAASK